MEKIQALIRGHQVRRIYPMKSVLERYFVIKEMSETEVSFNKSLEFMNFQICQPLIQAAQTPETTILPKLMIRSILPRIEDIFTNGCIISNTFEDVKVRWKYDSEFSSALMKCVCYLFTL